MTTSRALTLTSLTAVMSALTLALGGAPATAATHPTNPVHADPRKKTLWWTSEGERVVSADGTLLGDPWLRSASTTGKYLGPAEQPPQFHMTTQEIGRGDRPGPDVLMPVSVAEWQ